jgi:membrane protein DedA with SNARE-associated domain
MNETSEQEQAAVAAGTQRKILIIITIGLLCWGAYHALGSYFGGFGGANLQQDFRRSLVIFGFMVAFLAFWWGMMLFAPRKARTNRRK